VSGDILDCTVTDMSPSGAKSGLKVLGGGQYKIRGLQARGISGWVTRRPVYIADDLTGGSDVSVTIDGLNCKPGDGYNSVFINASNAKNVIVRNFLPVVSATQTAAVIQLENVAVVSKLLIDAVVAQSMPVNLNFLQVNSGGAIVELETSAMTVEYPSVGTASVYALLGTVQRFKLSGSHHYANARSVVLHGANAAAALALSFSPSVTTTNVRWMIQAEAVNQACSINFAGGVMDNYGGWVRAYNNGTGTVTVTGVAPTGLRTVTEGVTRVGTTELVRVVSDSMPVDLAKLTKTKGDRANNVNAGLACGTGPCVSDGTNWKNVYSAAVY